MTIASPFFPERISTAYRVTAAVVLGLMAATLAMADDRHESDPAANVSSPPPPEFAPLTSSERFSRYLLGIGDIESITRVAASSGIVQAAHTPKEWGRDAGGYGQRLGNAFAQHFIQRTLQYGMSAALHEDNRYFASGQTGFFRRARYAILSPLLARHDDGSRSVSFSHIGGAAGGAFISRAWQPRSTTSAGDGATTFGITMATDMAFDVFREFWPGLKRHSRKEDR
jgi:hypothetical protein